MVSTRQDAWSHDEDLLLAEIVLRHIREGGTQLQAFEKVGKKLSRTAAACGFRWNSFVRKQYASGIELAKKQRKERKKNPQLGEIDINQEELELVETPISSAIVENEQNDIIEFEVLLLHLKGLYDRAMESRVFNENVKTNEMIIQQLEKQLNDLSSENERLIKELHSIEKDYKSLIEIMERARKMVDAKNDHHQKV